MQFIKASKVQIFIKKKPKKNTKRCLDFRNVNIYGNKIDDKNDEKEESRFEPGFGDKNVPSTGGHEICSNLKNVNKAGINFFYLKYAIQHGPTEVRPATDLIFQNRFDPK